MHNLNDDNAVAESIEQIEQLKIALETILTHNGAEAEQIYQAIQKEGTEHSYQTAKTTSVKYTIIQEAKTSGYILKEKNKWIITPKGRAFLDNTTLNEAALEAVLNEVIKDDADTQAIETYQGNLVHPTNMPTEVDVNEESHTVFSWVRKLKKRQLILNPEFQRNIIWNDKQKSRFIESILLNIPIPPLYINQRKDGKYVIIDGLQRTSTLAEFINNQFELTGLQILIDLNACKFKQLSSTLQTKFEDKALLIYILKPSVPLPMVYDIFNRINTGGTQLNKQEIRNCLHTGQATHLLKELSEQAYFKQAIDNGISAKRMKDQEAILRYLAFTILDYKHNYKNNMDAFLNEALQRIEGMSKAELDHLKQEFERVMRLSYNFFGKHNFRLPTITEAKKGRGKINIALMEVIGYFFNQQSDAFLMQHKQKIIQNYHYLLQKPDFLDAIKHSTSDTKRVIRRFNMTQDTLGRL